jgi:hypothetical protein
MLIHFPPIKGKGKFPHGCCFGGKKAYQRVRQTEKNVWGESAACKRLRMDLLSVSHLKIHL